MQTQILSIPDALPLVNKKCKNSNFLGYKKLLKSLKANYIPTTCSEDENNGTENSGTKNADEKPFLCIFPNCRRAYENFKKWMAHYRCHVKIIFKYLILFVLIFLSYFILSPAKE